MGNNSGLSWVSLIASVVGALLLLSVVTGAWNYSVAGTWFLVSGIAGTVGAVTGWLARRSGANRNNTLGFQLGALVVVLFGAYALWGTIQTA
jgi:uncharacterized membrane protein YeaQ/YmgE (transglycosylase-associated protein family)